MNKHIPLYHPGTGNEAHRLTTWQDLQDLRKDLQAWTKNEFEQQLGTLEKRINVNLDGMERRFTEILAMRIVESEARLNKRIGLLEERMDRMEKTLDDIKKLLLASQT